jgi:uncharacterized protein
VNQIARLIILSIILLVPLSSQADDLGSLNLNRPVVDNAGILNSQEAYQIGQIIRSIRKQQGPHIGIVTLKELDGDTIENAAITIAEKWKLGSEKLDNGVIIVVADKERRIRIEVGNGIEGELPDAYAKQIIDAMTEYFKANKKGQGLLQGVALITQKVAPQINLSNIADSRGQRGRGRGSKSKPMSPLAMLIQLGIFLALMSTRFGRGMILMMLLSGRGGGGSSGSGGFGGGGGGFSGGGASGGW